MIAREFLLAQNSVAPDSREGSILNTLKNIGVVTISIGTIWTLGILLYLTSHAEAVDATTIVLFVWALTPYIILFVWTLKVHQARSSAAACIANFVSSLVVVIASVFFYYDAIFLSLSSTSVLVFLFVPGYALVAIPSIYLMTKFLFGLRNSRPHH